MAEATLRRACLIYQHQLLHPRLTSVPPDSGNRSSGRIQPGQPAALPEEVADGAPGRGPHAAGGAARRAGPADGPGAAGRRRRRPRRPGPGRGRTGRRPRRPRADPQGAGGGPAGARPRRPRKGAPGRACPCGGRRYAKGKAASDGRHRRRPGDARRASTSAARAAATPPTRSTPGSAWTASSARAPSGWPAWPPRAGRSTSPPTGWTSWPASGSTARRSAATPWPRPAGWPGGATRRPRRAGVRGRRGGLEFLTDGVFAPTRGGWRELKLGCSSSGRAASRPTPRGGPTASCRGPTASAALRPAGGVRRVRRRGGAAGRPGWG